MKIITILCFNKKHVKLTITPLFTASMCMTCKLKEIISCVEKLYTCTTIFYTVKIFHTVQFAYSSKFDHSG